jgi:transcriptional regulator with XRE-family HTH domain
MVTRAREHTLGAYLKDRRTRLDPAALGYPMTRRRTPGLRREEVAQRANLSTTWYTWLEQGRGGDPSPEVLDRLAHALMLTDIERNHLFLLAFGHPPAIRNRPNEGVTPRVQRVLDSLEFSPAIVRTGTWDVIAWNRAAVAVLGPFGTNQRHQMNILHRIFCNPNVRDAQTDWESVARFVVGAFRADSVRTGVDVTEFVEELSLLSPEFAALWLENDVISHTEGTKELRHPVVGMLTLEYSGFCIEGRPDLAMVVYSPATESDKDKIRVLIASNVVSFDQAMVST